MTTDSSLPTLKGVNKVIYDSTGGKYVATGTATSTDATTSVIQTSSDASTWTPMPYLSDPYGGALRDGNITDEFDGITYGEHYPPGTYYTDINLPIRGFRLPIFTDEYVSATWLTFKSTEDNSALIGLTSNLTTTPAGAYFVKSTNKGQSWATSVLLAPTTHATDEAWVDIETITISGTMNYVAVSNYGTIATSTSGVAWSYDTTSLANLVTTTNERINKIAKMTIAGTETLIIISNNNAYVSSNLTAWTKAQSTPWANYPVSDILVDNGYLIAISSASSKTPYRYTRDGITWSAMTSVTTAFAGKQIVKFGGWYWISTTNTSQTTAQYYKAQILNTGSIPTAVPQPGSLNQSGTIQRLFTFSNIGNTYTQLYLFLEEDINSNQNYMIVYVPDAVTGKFDQISSISSSDMLQVAGNHWIATISTNGTATATTSDYIVLLSAEGNNLYRTYENTGNPFETFTNFLNDTEYQTLADTLAASHATTTRMYTGLFGVGDRLPPGSAWNLAATTATKIVALDVGTGHTARNDNYAVLQPGGNNVATRTWKDITFGCNKFVTVTQNGFEWSVNGSLWNSTYPDSTYHRRPSDASNYDWHTIAYQPSNGTQLGRFYAIGNNISSGTKAMISYDGITWTYDGTMPSGTWNASKSNTQATVIVGASTNSAAVIKSGSIATKTLPATINWNDVVHGNELKYYNSISGYMTAPYTINAMTPQSKNYVPFKWTLKSLDQREGGPLTFPYESQLTYLNVWGHCDVVLGDTVTHMTVYYGDGRIFTPLLYDSVTGLIKSFVIPAGQIPGINFDLNTVTMIGSTAFYAEGGTPNLNPFVSPSSLYNTYKENGLDAIATAKVVNGQVTWTLNNRASYWFFNLPDTTPLLNDISLYVNETTDLSLVVDDPNSHAAMIKEVMIPNFYIGWPPNNKDWRVFSYDNTNRTIKTLFGGYNQSSITAVGGQTSTIVSGPGFALTNPVFSINMLNGSYSVTGNDAGYNIGVESQLIYSGNSFGAHGISGYDPTSGYYDLTIETLSDTSGFSSQGEVLNYNLHYNATPWVAPTFDVVRKGNAITINLKDGGNANFGTSVKILGSIFNDVSGATPANDIVLTTTVDSNGKILTISNPTLIPNLNNLDNGRFVAVGVGVTGAYSDDSGMNWSSITLPSNQTWTSIAYAPIAIFPDPATNYRGVYIAVASGTNVVAYSIDGQTWTSSTLPKSSTWSRVEFFKGRFIMFDGTRYPVVSNVISAIDTTRADLGITWRDYGAEYLPYWTSTTMTNLVYDGTHYVGVGYGTLPSGSQVNLIWKSTTLSGAKASWRIYASTAPIQNLQLNGTDIVFKDAGTVSKFTTTFLSDADTVGHFIGSTETASLATIDPTVTKIEFTGSNAYVYYPDGSITVYDVA